MNVIRLFMLNKNTLPKFSILCPDFLKKVKLSLPFNWAPRHASVLGEWRYSSTHSLTSALDGDVWSISCSVFPNLDLMLLASEFCESPQFPMSIWRNSFCLSVRKICIYKPSSVWVVTLCVVVSMLLPCSGWSEDGGSMEFRNVGILPQPSRRHNPEDRC
jgi:hypothetical protein